MYAALFVHRCKINRRTGALDRFGQPLRLSQPGSYSQVADVPCRLNEKTGGLSFTERTHDTLQESGTLFLQPGANIREDDSVEVYDPRTQYALLKDATVAQMRNVYDSRSLHHVECRLTSIRGSDAGGDGAA